MNIFITGIVILIAIHLLPSVQPLRNQLINRLGLWPYKGLFAIIALTGLILVINGMSSAEEILVWNSPSWSQSLALIIMPISLILIVAAYLPSNIKRITPHPMLWGVSIWAVVHILSNSDLNTLILSGAIGVYALFDIMSANIRGAKVSENALSPAKDIIVIVVGLVLYSLALIFHEHISGVAIFN